MKKAIVIGCPGSGKSTFARRLRDKTGLPLYYLDMIWHKPDKTTVSRDEFDASLGEILSRDCWIIDGNYARTLERRLQNCDTVFLFELSAEECLEGVKSRIGKPREEMPWTETELDPEFASQIRSFSEDTLPKVHELLKKYGDGRKIHVFRSHADAETYLKA